MFIHFFCLCPLSLPFKLNFNTSKIAYLLCSDFSCAFYHNLLQFYETKFYLTVFFQPLTLRRNKHEKIRKDLKDAWAKACKKVVRYLQQNLF